jgi:hypothetical protein
MADPKNQGQFGNRSDTSAMASEGGQASSAKQDMSKLGKKGAEAQSHEAKAKGGQHSHRNG